MQHEQNKECKMMGRQWRSVTALSDIRDQLIATAVISKDYE